MVIFNIYSWTLEVNSDSVTSGLIKQQPRHGTSARMESADSYWRQLGAFHCPALKASVQPPAFIQAIFFPENSIKAAGFSPP